MWMAHRGRIQFAPTVEETGIHLSYPPGTAGEAISLQQKPLLLRRGAERCKAERSVFTPPGFALLSHPPQRGGLFTSRFRIRSTAPPEVEPREDAGEYNSPLRWRAALYPPIAVGGLSASCVYPKESAREGVPFLKKRNCSFFIIHIHMLTGEVLQLNLNIIRI